MTTTAQRVATLDRIESLLSATNGTTRFAKVYRFEPLGLPPGPGPFVAFWYDGEDEHEETLSNVMVHERFVVRMYWPKQVSETRRRDYVAEMWNAVRNVQAAFRADSDLGGNVTDSKPSPSSYDDETLGGSDFHTLSFELIVWNLEEEGITA